MYNYAMIALIGQYLDTPLVVREKQMWEERIKTREELARRAEEAGRKLEAEYQQRINEQVNRSSSTDFKSMGLSWL